MSSEESSEEWTPAERIIVHHNPETDTWTPLLEEIKENGEIAPVDRAALRASFTSIIHNQWSSQRKLRSDADCHFAHQPVGPTGPLTLISGHLLRTLTSALSRD